ncbi:MAG: glycosyltransferase family 2 protein [Thermodesulfobacteriota bacterium]
MRERPATDLPLISLVAPVYNEEAIVRVFVTEVMGALEAIQPPVAYEIVLVNDGSSDRSGELLDGLAAEFPGGLKVIHLSRNFGHGPAIFAGLDQSRGDAVILMDSDLQDDPAAFAAFIEKWRQGYDAVYAMRTARNESLPIRLAMAAFYRLLGMISSTPIQRDSGTFSLMTRRLVDLLKSMPEQNCFLPGLRSWIGFRQTSVPVPRRSRHDQNSRVGIFGLVKLSMNAIFSFSYFPIFVFQIVGIAALLCGFGLALFVLYHKFLTHRSVATWASEMLSILFFGGINLFGLGIIGEYIARIYDELKARPRYVIDHITQSVPVPDKGKDLAQSGGEGKK